MRVRADFATIQGWKFYHEMLLAKGKANVMAMASGPTSVKAPDDALNPTEVPMVAADRDPGPHTVDTRQRTAVDRAHGASSNSQANQYRVGGVSFTECEGGVQGPDQEGWDLEYEWLQEMEREQDEVGPWADFV